MSNDPLGLFDDAPAVAGNDPLGLFEEDKSKYLSEEDKKKAIREGLTGMVDTGLGMISGLPGQIAGGLAGLSTLASGQGLDKAADTSQKVQESNFGMGAYKPFSKTGEEMTQGVGNAMDTLKEKAGNVGYSIGGELGRTNAQIATEGILNLVEPGAVLGLIKGGFKFRPKVGEIPVVAPTDGAPSVASIMADADRKARREAIAPTQDPLGLFTDSEGNTAVNEFPQGKIPAEDPAVLALAQQKAVEAQAQAKAAQVAQERLANGDPNGQMALFDHGDQMGQRNQFNAGDLGDWRVDENGMPVRVDKSMEASNVEAPLQRNLFGDELPQTGLEGKNVPLTQAIDSIPDTPFKGDAREQALGRLQGDVPAGNDLLAAKIQADGPKLPFDENTTFDPKNPLPTMRMADMDRMPPKGGEIPPQPTAPFSPEAPKVKEAAPSGTILTAEPSGVKPPPLPDTTATPRSPEMIAKKQEQRQAASMIPSSDPRFAEFERVSTPEEAFQLAKDSGFKDNAPSVVGRNLGSGANFHAIMTNNPVIKYINTVFKDARTNAENFSKMFVTAKDTGLAPLWSKMTDAERMRVSQLSIASDFRKLEITPEIAERLQLSDKERAYLDTFRKADNALFDRDNLNKVQLGMKPVPYRESHSPGIFVGAYKALVTDAKGVTAVLAADTWGQLKAAKEHMLAKNPDLKIVEQPRKGLAKYRNESDIFSGMNDILQMLAENDPRFAEAQAMVQEAIKHGNNSIFAFNTHELSKKGVIGSEGNKPWLSAKENADSWHQAMVKYFEEGALHHELQIPLKETKDLLLNPELDMPKTKTYVQSYLDHITGKSANNPFAQAAHAAIDFLPEKLGFGPRTALAGAGQLKNRMSQVFMGFGNVAFTTAQFFQPMQTALPLMTQLGGKMGNMSRAPLSLAKGNAAFLKGFLEDTTGKKMDMTSDQRAAYEYAKSHGITSFSEMEKAYEGNSSKFMRGFNKAAEFNMQIGETATRGPTFMGFVDLLRHGDVPLDKALVIADNATRFSMFDYHAWERPQVYAKGGIVGQFAGGLTTFKHAYVGNVAKALKESPKNPVPILASAAAMVFLAGIQGAPFYDELDNLYGSITNKFGERKNIRDSFLQNLPEWSKSGGLGQMTGMAVQSKFSSANMIPDYERPGAALSPQLAAAGQILMDAIDIAKHGDKQGWANLALDMSPTTLKGEVENQLFNENGDLVNRNREAIVHRTDDQWTKRRITGLRDNNEMLQREQDYRARTADMADQEAKKKITTDYNRSIMNDNPDFSKADEFAQRGGDRKSLFSLERFKEEALKKTLTESERAAAGVKNEGTMKKFEYYNKPGER